MEPKTKDLTVQLTEEEVAERSKAMASTLSEIDDLEAQKAERAKEFATSIKTREKRLRELAHAVSTHTEKRPIPISERADPRRFTIETIRHDTMEVIDTRAMTQDEVAEANQPNLFERSTADSDDGGQPKTADAPPKTTVCEGCSAVLKEGETMHRVLDSITGKPVEGPGGEKALYHCDGCHASYVGGATTADGRKTKRSKKDAAAKPEAPATDAAATDGSAISKPGDLLAAAEEAATDKH